MTSPARKDWLEFGVEAVLVTFLVGVLPAGVIGVGRSSNGLKQLRSDQPEQRDTAVNDDVLADDHC